MLRFNTDLVINHQKIAASPYVTQDCIIIGHCTQASGVSSKKARASLKPDTRHLKPMLRKGFATPDNVQKKRPIFLSFYEVCDNVHFHIEKLICPLKIIF